MQGCRHSFDHAEGAEPEHCPKGHLPETVNGELVTVEVAAPATDEEPPAE